MEDEDTENIIPPEDLDESPQTDMALELDSDESDFMPPDEKNNAKRLNVGNVFAVIFLGIAIIIGLIMILSKPKKEKQKETELNKAGQKYIPEIKELSKNNNSTPVQITENDYSDSEDIDKILESLPNDFQTQSEPSKAPVSPVGSKSSSSAERPDTRNSKSVRKVEGIAGQDYVAQGVNNQNIISAMMNGNGYYPQSSSGYGGNGMTKEEYIDQLMSMTSSAVNAGIGNSGASQQQLYQTNKENFYSNGSSEIGRSGEYLSYATLWEGTVIPAALQTAINTDNPGLVIARVTENVYSSYDGSFLLIPEGSLLYATYNSSVSYGQSRIQVAWNLLIRPDGYRVQLGNMNGVDSQGASGYKGKVSNHPFETLKALGLVAVYSIIQTEIQADINAANNQYVQNAMSDTYAEASKIGNKIVDKALDIKPTIRIKSGTEIKLITNTTLDLPPVKINQVTRRYTRTQ